MSETFGITKEETLAAIKAGDAAQKSFDTELKKAGAKVLEDVQKAGKFAVVLASRPYQNDALVNHDLSLMFTNAGNPSTYRGLYQKMIAQTFTEVVLMW